METYNAVKNRILFLCKEKHFTINKLATESGVAPSTVKNILYGKSQNPGIVWDPPSCPKPRSEDTM